MVARVTGKLGQGPLCMGRADITRFVSQAGPNQDPYIIPKAHLFLVHPPLPLIQDGRRQGEAKVKTR